MPSSLIGQHVVAGAIVFCCVASWVSAARAQGSFETNTHWHADMAQNIFVDGRFDRLDEKDRPAGWDDVSAFESGHASVFGKGGNLRLVAAEDGDEVAVSTTLDLPKDVEFLTVRVKIRARDMVIGDTKDAGGGVTVSMIHENGSRRVMPRLDPSYAGEYRNYRNRVETVSVLPGETQMQVKVQVVDAKGTMDLEDIWVMPSKPSFVPTDQQRTELMEAIRDDDDFAVTLMINREPRLLEARLGGFENTTPLGQAAVANAEEVCKVLLDAGADLEATSFNMLHTPLGWAYWNGSVESAKCLIDHGASCDQYASRTKSAKWARSSPEQFDKINQMIQQKVQQNAGQADQNPATIP